MGQCERETLLGFSLTWFSLAWYCVTFCFQVLLKSSKDPRSVHPGPESRGWVSVWGRRLARATGVAARQVASRQPEPSTATSLPPKRLLPGRLPVSQPTPVETESLLVTTNSQVYQQRVLPTSKTTNRKKEHWQRQTKHKKRHEWTWEDSCMNLKLFPKSVDEG